MTDVILGVCTLAIILMLWTISSELGWELRRIARYLEDIKNQKNKTQ